VNILVRELRKGGVYLDVGAHIRRSRNAVRPPANGARRRHRHRFRADPDSAGRLDRALVANGITNVTLIRAAAGIAGELWSFGLTQRLPR
jgi:hypothetical protein